MEQKYYSVENTFKIKETLFKLKLENHEDYETYREIKLNYIKAFSGLALSRTYDSNYNEIIGHGFNMNRPEAMTEWNHAFRNPETRPDFDLVKSGKINLTEAQADILFQYGIDIREKELQDKYGRVWNIMNPSIKLALESLYYQGGNVFIGKQTNFYKNLIQFYGLTNNDIRVEPGSLDTLKNFVFEVKERSNKYKNDYIQRIRDSQALLLDISTCPDFSIDKFIKDVNEFWDQKVLPMNKLQQHIELGRQSAPPREDILPKGTNVEMTSDVTTFVLRANFTLRSAK